MKQIKTKQTTLHRPRWALIAIVAMLTVAGCTQTDEEPANKDSSRRVMLNAVTKGVVDGGTDMTLYFAFAHETSVGTYNSYGGSYTGTRSAGTGVQPFAPYSLVLKYNIGGLKTKITGWHPGGGTAANPGNGYYDTTAKTVTWTINGTQDIIISAAKEGSVASPIPPLVFEHCLTQILFHPYAETQSAIDAWGKITRIEVVKQQNTVQYSLINNDATGAVTFTGTADKTMISTGVPTGGAALSLSSIADKGTKALRMGDPMMIAPNAAGNNITLNIFTENKEIKTITLNRELKAGTPYRLYLQFTERDVFINTTITQWTPVDNKNTVGKVNVGDYRDGGIVYYIDPNTPGSYYVMSLDEPTVGTDNRLQWAARNDYTLGAQCDNADGRVNVAAIKAAFDSGIAGVGITEARFEDAFPATAYCYNYQGKAANDAKGTWYLPAKNEIQYLYCVFNGASAISWTDNAQAPSEDTGAQSRWNALITTAGGTLLKADEAYWISAEAPVSTSGNPSNYAWDIYFKNGITSSVSRYKRGVNSVRCIRRGVTTTINP